MYSASSSLPVPVHGMCLTSFIKIWMFCHVKVSIISQILITMMSENRYESLRITFRDIVWLTLNPRTYQKSAASRKKSLTSQLSHLPLLRSASDSSTQSNVALILCQKMQNYCARTMGRCPPQLSVSLELVLSQRWLTTLKVSVQTVWRQERSSLSSVSQILFQKSWPARPMELLPA